MNFKFLLPFKLLLLLWISVEAQVPFFEVLSIEGTAKVQRSQKRDWEKITVGTKLLDNDLVETYFQTKLLIRFGENNLIILGSNSKALLNIVPKEDNQVTKSNVSLTLFGGGIFAKAISKCHISFYSANAVGELDSGSVSTVTDAKSGETGFQVLGGSVYVRNIAQQKGVALRAGLTTMILPNKEPTAPLYLTHRHVAVLKHFFGDEYITNELSVSGIEPTDETGSASRLALSQNLSKNSSNNKDLGTFKPLFSPNKVYGYILNDQDSFPKYKPITRHQYSTSNKWNIGLYSNLGINSGGLKNSYSLIPSIRFPKFYTSFQFALSQNSFSRMNAGFSSIQGILDKIRSFALGNISDSTFIYLGKIEDYSLGYGLVVDHFSNIDPNRIFNSPGLIGQIRIKKDFDFKVFLGNLTNPVYGGAYVSYKPSIYCLGLGYYFDFNLYKVKFYPDEFRYVSLEKQNASIPDQRLNPANYHIYEIDLATNIISTFDFKMDMLVEFAQKIHNGNDGIVVRVPTILWDIKDMRFGASLIFEAKRLLSSNFSPFYLSNRYRVKNDESGIFEDTIFTQDNHLSNKRRSTGFALTFKTNPIKGMDVDVYYKQDFISRNTLNIINSDQNTDSSQNVSGDFTVQLNCRINDTLVSFFKYAEIYLQQYHGRLFPGKANIFSSWAMQSGFNLLTRPLLFKTMAFEAGGKLLYIDRNNNNQVDGSDLIFEFFMGVQWGFL